MGSQPTKHLTVKLCTHEIQKLIKYNLETQHIIFPNELLDIMYSYISHNIQPGDLVYIKVLGPRIENTKWALGRVYYALHSVIKINNDTVETCCIDDINETTRKTRSTIYSSPYNYPDEKNIIPYKDTQLESFHNSKDDVFDILDDDGYWQIGQSYFKQVAYGYINKINVVYWNIMYHVKEHKLKRLIPEGITLNPTDVDHSRFKSGDYLIDTYRSHSPDYSININGHQQNIIIGYKYDLSYVLTNLWLTVTELFEYNVKFSISSGMMNDIWMHVTDFKKLFDDLNKCSDKFSLLISQLK